MLVGTSTFATGELARVAERLLDVADRAGARVVVDLNARAHLWGNRRKMIRAAGALVARAALVKASREDLLALAPGAGALSWLERHAPRASWLITRRGATATAIGEHGEVALPALRARDVDRCVDPTGAGDAFLAGSLATLLAARAIPGSKAWQEPAVWRAALRVGHILGRKAVSRPGSVAGLLRLGRARAIVESLRKEHP